MRNVIIVFLSVLLSAQSFAQDSLTLEKVIKKALQNNHSIQVARMQEGLVSNDVFIGNAGMLPKVEVVGGGNYSNQISDLQFAGGIPPVTDTRAISSGLNSGLRLTYTLFDGLGMFRTYEQLKNKSSLTSLQTKLNIESSIMQVLNLYLNLLRIQKQMEINKDIMDISKNRLERVRARKEFGGAGSVDVLNAQVDFYNDSSSWMRAQQNLENNRRRLAFYLGESLEVNYKLSDLEINKVIPSLDSLLNAAKNNHGSVVLTQVQLDMSEMDKKLIHSRMMPRLGVDFQYGYSRSDNNAGVLLKSEAVGFTGNVSLSWNLFDGMKQQRALQNASISIDQAEIKREQALNQVELEMYNAVKNFHMIKTILNLELKNIEAAKQSNLRSESLYFNGQITGLDFRRTQLNLKKAQLNYLNASLDLMTYYYEILRLSDQLLN